VLPQTTQHNLFHSNPSLRVSFQQCPRFGAIKSKQFYKDDGFDCAVSEAVEDQEPLVPEAVVTKALGELDGKARALGTAHDHLSLITEVIVEQRIAKSLSRHCNR